MNTSLVTHLYEKNVGRSVVSNYRTVSKLSALPKLLEKLQEIILSILALGFH